MLRKFHTLRGGAVLRVVSFWLLMAASCCMSAHEMAAYKSASYQITDPCAVQPNPVSDMHWDNPLFNRSIKISANYGVSKLISGNAPASRVAPLFGKTPKSYNGTVSLSAGQEDVHAIQAQSIEGGRHTHVVAYANEGHDPHAGYTCPDCGHTSSHKQHDDGQWYCDQCGKKTGKPCTNYDPTPGPEPAPIGEAGTVMIIMALMYALFLLVKNDAKEDMEEP